MRRSYEKTDQLVKSRKTVKTEEITCCHPYDTSTKELTISKRIRNIEIYSTSSLIRTGKNKCQTEIRHKEYQEPTKHTAMTKKYRKDNEINNIDNATKINIS